MSKYIRMTGAYLCLLPMILFYLYFMGAKMSLSRFVVGCEQLFLYSSQAFVLNKNTPASQRNAVKDAKVQSQSQKLMNAIFENELKLEMVNG